MKIAEWRKRNNLTQARFAELVGLAAPTVSQLESRSRRPSAEVARRIEFITKGEVSAAELLGVTRPVGIQEESVAIEGEVDPHPYRGDKGSLVLNLPLGLLEAAEEYGLDAAALVLEGGREKLEAEVRREFRTRNAEAIEWTRKYIEEHGTLSQQFGMI